MKLIMFFSNWVIDHKLLVPGHTRMKCDSDRVKIETAHKKYSALKNHHYN
jgi:hypothetical protein